MSAPQPTEPELSKEQTKLLARILEAQRLQQDAIIQATADIENHLIEGVKRQEKQVKYLRNISAAASAFFVLTLLGMAMIFCQLITP